MAQMLLQDLNLPADGGLGDAELARGPGEIQMPGGSLEGHEAVGRRQAAAETSHQEN
jgi:hypothetical protein